MIIGISGLAGAGKDTAADFLAREHDFVVVSLADPLKRICLDVFQFSVDQLWGDSRLRNMPDRRYPRRADFWEYPHAPVGAVWIPLFGDRGYALIDERDFERVTAHRWTLNKKESGKNTDYARATIDGEKISLHVFLNAPSEGLVVDHINGNGLDNRRKNTRVCTKGENRRNSEKRKDGESVFKGVGRIADRDGWRAYINIRGKLRTIGYYELEEEAALAYDEAAGKEFGDFARLNSDRFLTPRYALQRLGSEWGRDCYSPIWTEYVIRVYERLRHGAARYDPRRGVYGDTVGHDHNPKDVVIPDVRFRNEVDALRAHDAKLIRVVRPSAGLSGAAGQHVSETEQASMPDELFDAVIQNDRDLQALRAEVSRLIQQWKGTER